jgi:hypothetical protein
MYDAWSHRRAMRQRTLIQRLSYRIHPPFSLTWPVPSGPWQRMHSILS